MTDPQNASGFAKYMSALTSSVVDKAWEASWAARIIFIVFLQTAFLFLRIKEVSYCGLKDVLQILMLVAQ